MKKVKLHMTHELARHLYAWLDKWVPASKEKNFAQMTVHSVVNDVILAELHGKINARVFEQKIKMNLKPYAALALAAFITTYPVGDAWLENELNKILATIDKTYT